MKRIFSIVSIILLLCLTMTACVGPAPTPSGPNEQVDNSIYGKLTRAVGSSDFDTLTVTVSTTTNEELTLTSIYSYEAIENGLKIEYLIEKLGQFEESNGVYIKPDDMIELLSGSVTVADGAVISSNGAAAPIDLSFASLPSFNFKEGYFSAVEYNDTVFSAGVLSPLAFMGMTESCSNMNVSVSYDDNGINEINLTYNISGGTKVAVEYVYE